MKKPQLATTFTQRCSKDSPIYNTMVLAQYLRGLHKITAQYLPPLLSAHCQVSAYNNGELAIYCDSASWSSKLRFHVPHLKKKLALHQDFSELSSIMVKTDLSTLTKRNKRSPSRAKPISMENRDILLATAASEPDALLSDALRRLAVHACKTKSQKHKT